MKRPPYRRCRVCRKRYHDYGRPCPRGALHRKILDALDDAPAPAPREHFPHAAIIVRHGERKARRRDPLLEKLSARARRKRWEMKQPPSTLAALAERRKALFKVWRKKKLEEDPEWGRKRYRKYRRRA